MSGGMKVDVPAVATVAAAGSSPRDVFLPSEGQAAVSAVACFYMNFGVINEHTCRLTRRCNRKWEGLLEEFVSSLVCGDHVDEMALVSSTLELDRTSCCGVKGVVPSTSYIGAWFDGCATLSHQDGPSGDELTIESFYSQPL